MVLKTPRGSRRGGDLRQKVLPFQDILLIVIGNEWVYSQTVVRGNQENFE